MIPRTLFSVGIMIVSDSIAYAMNDNLLIKTIDGGGDAVNSVKDDHSISHFLLLVNNPIFTSANFFINGLTQQTEFQLFDALGRSLYKENISPSTTSLYLDMHQYPSGIYFVKLGQETVKFIKQ